jgi:hypothetical protein
MNQVSLLPAWLSSAINIERTMRRSTKESMLSEAKTRPVTRKTFMASPTNIAAERDFNRIKAAGIPADALEKELGKFEGVIAPGIRRVRETASFGEKAKDREDIINLITLLAVRNPRTRRDMEEVYTGLFRSMLVMPFETRWPEDKPADYDGHKEYVEQHKDKLRANQNFSLEMELRALPEIYFYFDARRWRILKARAGSGDFVTTDHPVCVHKPACGINYGQQFAPGLGLADRDILVPLSSKIALIGRLQGEEDVIVVDQHNVASFNATTMGFAMKQIYAAGDQYPYARPAHYPIGRGATLLQDPNLKVRED